MLFTSRARALLLSTTTLLLGITGCSDDDSSTGAGGTSGTTTGTGTGGATTSTGTEGTGGEGGAGTGGEGGAGTGGEGGAGTGGEGGAGGAGGASTCMPGSSERCYSGPAGTGGVGICRGGQRICAADGSGHGPCMGEVLPSPETCETPADEDCDGEANEEGSGCVCIPNQASPCYDGPSGTLGVGACVPGTHSCNAEGTGFGFCLGQVTPAAESCATPADDDCDGEIDEGCGPVAVSYATDVRPILQTYCSPCHTSGAGSGSYNVNNYSSTQASSYYCAGQTKGACSLARIQNGTMPAGRGCTGNPASDVGNSSCLNAAQQSTIEAWITGGQQP
jgi:hypothetical protein